MSSLIKQIQVAVRDKSLVIGRPQVNALRKYFNNTQRNPRDKITELNKVFFSRGPYPLESEFNSASVAWMRKLMLKKDGTPRATEQVKRLNQKQIEVIQNLSSFNFVGMMEEDDTYEIRQFPGHERVQSFAVWRACSFHGDTFDYYCKPWQQHYDGAETGVFLFPSEGGV